MDLASRVGCWAIAQISLAARPFRRGFGRRPGRPALAAFLAFTSLGLVLGRTVEGSQAQAAPNPPETRHVETLAPGVEHISIRRGDFTEKAGTDRWTIHVLNLDPSQVRLELARAMDEGVGIETVSSMAGRHGAVAAINGGYFRTGGLYRGEPAGFLEVAGRVLSEPSRGRPGLAVGNTAGGVRMTVVTVNLHAEVVASNGAARPIDGINGPRGPGDLCLFTPEFHRTTLTGAGGVEAVIIDGLVTAVLDGQGSARIPENGVVLSGSGNGGQWIRHNLGAGQTAALRTEASVTPQPGFAPDFIIGGGPLLVRDGRPAADSDPGKYDPGFIAKRHPRTAAGVRGDGTVVLVVVDGRHPASSVGMTIREMSDLMIEFGSVEAVNLDGGGSTTMVVKDAVVNNPSDPTGERPVGDALLVFVRPPLPGR
jgi:exopolysaccharide biosynthesis protein